jgi:hypothetical protein
MTHLTNKVATLAATVMLALGVTTVQVNQAQAGKGGRIVAGAILGAAALAIIASEGRRAHAHGHYYKHRSRHRYGRYRTCYDRYGDPYRCYRKRKHHRRNWRRSRRHHNHW